MEQAQLVGARDGTLSPIAEEEQEQVANCEIVESIDRASAHTAH